MKKMASTAYHTHLFRECINWLHVKNIQGGPKVTTHTQPFNNSRNLSQNFTNTWVRRSLIKCWDQVSSRSWNDHNLPKLQTINLKFWEFTWIMKPNVFVNFWVSSSKHSHFMATIVKKKEWRATPSVINEILRNFQKF